MSRAPIVAACASLCLSLLSAIPAHGGRPGRPPVADASRTLLAGAQAAPVDLPAGVPLAGYGSLRRRLRIPDLLNRHPYAFWFKPSTGTHDPITVRALVLDSRERRVLWIAVDLVGVDTAMVNEVRERLAAAGHRYDAVILSASHTHSGPGAFVRSALFGFVALDRFAPEIRERILAAVVQAARSAEALKTTARVGSGRGEVAGVTRSRVGLPLDPEVGVLKVLRADGRPLALVWNYAIHGTALGAGNLELSGDVMGAASRELEQTLGVPVLYTNGAVGDVSPARHGWPGLGEMARALSQEVLAAWDRTPAADPAGLRALSERIRLPAPRLSARNCLGRLLPAWLTVGMEWAVGSESEMVAVGIGRSAWVTIPGELQTRLGQTVKREGRRLFRHAFVVGVANDYRGYFLAPEQHRRPAYIACASLYGEDGGRLIVERATALLRALAGTGPDPEAGGEKGKAQ